MKWDVFRPKREAGDDPLQEAIDNQEKAIERFAPRKYRVERERHYYNDKIMPLYREKLLAFLETVSRRERSKEEPQTLARDLFLALRIFYDPREKACSEAIARDPAFRRKFREIYRYFYDRESPLFREIADWFIEADN
jgi:hypothetical protein